MDDDIVISTTFRRHFLISLEKRNIFCCFTNCCLWKNLKKMSRAELNKLSWISFGYKGKTIALPPIFELLMNLYNGKDVLEGLESCRINPDFTPERHIRNDLEYYIPQLTNFMIFHQDSFNHKLNAFLEEASLAEPYFAHSYYWHVLSLIPAISEQKAQTLLGAIIKKGSETPQTQLFVTEYAKFHLALRDKLSPDDYEVDLMELQTRKVKAEKLIQSYRSGELDMNSVDFEISGMDLELKPYVPTDAQNNNDDFFSNPFTATLLFFNDLAIVGDEVGKASARMEYLHTALRHLNKSLPSCVYVPFVKDSIRHYAILNIIAEETKIFPTKTRAPFKIVIEIFRPQLELSHEYINLFHPEHKKEKKENIIDYVRKTLFLDKILPLVSGQEDGDSEQIDPQFNIDRIAEIISSPRTIKKIRDPQYNTPPQNLDNALDINRTSYSATESFMKSTIEVPDQEGHESYPNIPRRISLTETRPRKLSSEKFSTIRVIDLEEKRESIFKPPSHVPHSYPLIVENSLMKSDIDMFGDLNAPLLGLGHEEKETTGDDGQSCSLSHEEIVDIFGEDSNDQLERIRQNSPYKHLKTWRLVHMIVKNGADMKEEQFATQLISQFDQIFKAEGLKLYLTPYEIVSLGSDFGVVEFIRDTITISRLKEKMYNLGINTLDEFFIKYYGNNVERARRRFCRSLAAYSILCYFLQIKDRHNGNIMFHKEGHILHIDFGFFLSNSPGKGLEFERKVPFKLMNDYIEVLGGTRSGLFQEFRKLFYQGFMAARKHREQILILVKMMYSSQGKNLPCFKAGIKSITELEQRFCPPGVHEDDLKEYCYNLINQSLDNWRAKCYDKYQYHFQGIFY